LVNIVTFRLPRVCRFHSACVATAKTNLKNPQHNNKAQPVRRSSHTEVTMTIAYLDCFAGIAGDMTLAALLDCGVPLEALREGLSSCPLKAGTSRHNRFSKAASRHSVSNSLHGVTMSKNWKRSRGHTPCRARTIHSQHTITATMSTP
jgi:hypothetical protein